MIDPPCGRNFCHSHIYRQAGCLRWLGGVVRLLIMGFHVARITGSWGLEWKGLKVAPNQCIISLDAHVFNVGLNRLLCANLGNLYLLFSSLSEVGNSDSCVLRRLLLREGVDPFSDDVVYVMSSSFFYRRFFTAVSICCGWASVSF